MNPASGWCEGCLRTLDEIAAWVSLDDEGKRAIVAQLRARRRRWRELRRKLPVLGDVAGDVTVDVAGDVAGPLL